MQSGAETVLCYLVSVPASVVGLKKGAPPAPLLTLPALLYLPRPRRGGERGGGAGGYPANGTTPPANPSPRPRSCTLPPPPPTQPTPFPPGVEESEVAALAGSKEGCHDDVEYTTVGLFGLEEGRGQNAAKRGQTRPNAPLTLAKRGWKVVNPLRRRRAPAAARAPAPAWRRSLPARMYARPSALPLAPSRCRAGRCPSCTALGRASTAATGGALGW